MNAPVQLPLTVAEDEQPAERAPAQPAPATSGREFDWLTEDCVVVEEQPPIAVYRNRRNHLIIRSQGNGYDEEDSFVFVATLEALKLLIAALQRELKAWGQP